ncbi:MAG: PilZ domain-containing protein [Thermodesulfobacteriota bacterium]|nr:PilZ domain-containing protein [Thermodesulfobacteriota bacterium]
MVGTKERRRLARKPIDAKAICNFLGYDDIFGRVRNISADGAYIVLHAIIGLAGKSMNLSVDVEKYGKVIPFTGTVVWSEPESLGVKFHKPVDPDVELL